MTISSMKFERVFKIIVAYFHVLSYKNVFILCPLFTHFPLMTTTNRGNKNIYIFLRFFLRFLRD